MAVAHQTLDQLIANLEAQLEDARRLKEIAQRRPELLAQMMGGNHTSKAPRRRPAGAGPTAWERVVAYFEERDNAEATIDQIHKDTKLNAVAIREQFYRRHRDDVTSRKDGKTVYWKLKR